MTSSAKAAPKAAAIVKVQPVSAASVLATAGLVGVSSPVVDSGSTVLTVGKGKEFATVAAAIGASHDGDTILVDAGTYTNDFSTITTRITLIGVGGVVNMVATVPPTNLKGILTVDADTTIRNFSFSGVSIPDWAGGNGAGVRYEGGQLVLSNCSFSNNQNGIMGNPVAGLAVNTVSIDHCVFASNGSGTGYTHNLYIGAVDKLTATNSVFEYANVGHEFKSRAVVNDIEGNVFRDGPTATASYDIDLPNGGNATVIGNVIEKGPQAQNNAMIHYGGEGIPYAGSQLTVSGNVLQNDRGNSAVAVLNQTPFSATISGNQFVGFAGATIATGPATETGNIDGNAAALPDSTLSGVLPGSTDIITDALAHSVTLAGSLQAVEGGGGLLTAYALGGHIIAIGGTGGMNFAESPTSGGNSVTTKAGSVNSVQVVGQDVIDSEGIDRIVTGGGNITAKIGGIARIDDGTGNNQWTVSGTATIVGHGSNPVVSVGPAGNAVITGPLGYLQVVNNGGKTAIDIVQGGAAEAVSIAGGAVNLRVDNAQMSVATAGGTQGTVLRFGAGAATVTSNGPDVIWAGSGAETIIVAGHAEVHAGTGSLALYGRSSTGATFYGNGGRYLLDGDSGNITYYGGSRASTVDLHLSNNTLVGGTGRLTVNGGSREILIGGSGGLVYSATDGGGANTITTAAGASNTLVLAGADTVNSWGWDTIDGGVANQSMTIHGIATVTGSTGISNLTFSGYDTLNGRGQDVCTVTAGANLLVHAGNMTRVSERGGVVQFNARPAAGQTAAASANLIGGAATIANNADGSIGITTDAGNSTTVQSLRGPVAITTNGADTIQTGAGPDTIAVNASNTQIWGGSGDLTVHDWSWDAGNKVTVHGGAGNFHYAQGACGLVFIGGSGAATIDGAYGKLDVTGGAGALALTGGQSGVRFVAGSGAANVALTPGGGDITFGAGNTTVQVASYGAADLFRFVAGHGGGQDLIAGFRAGVDQLLFQGGVGVATQQTTGLGTRLTLTDGTQVQLTSVINTALFHTH